MRHLLAILGVILLPIPLVAQGNELVDTGLKVVVIDSDAKELLLSVRADTRGRLFVGGSESLFVYEPNEHGGYHPRKVLCKFPADSLLRDVELRGNDLYILTRSALYIIPDGVRNRDNLQPKKLIWGVPAVLPNRGFHGLAWGPEGDLYLTLEDSVHDYVLSFSDRWGHWTVFSQPEGTKIPNNGVGGVMRCKPDGSGLQIVARGLRRAGALVFDPQWNLFSNDQGHYYDNELGYGTHIPGRLLHITPHAYFNWPYDRIPKQTPERADRLQAMMLPSGTEAQSYYDETLLPEKYRHNLLIAQDARDPIASSLVKPCAVVRYLLKPHGGSFQVTEHTLLQANYFLKAQSITVGRGGRIFVILSFQFDKRVTKLLMLTKADDPPTHPFAPYESTEATPEKLWQELSDPSWQRRYRAHLELTRRGGDLLTEANKRLLAARPSDPAFHSLIWLAAKSQKGNVHLIALTDHADPLIRVQAIRALTEYPEQLHDEPIFTKALLDKHPQVQHSAVLAFFSPKIAWDRAIQQAIERGPACSKDSYLRQSATLLLAQKATVKQLEDLCGRFDAPLRLAGVLAAGFRLTLPDATKPLAQHLPLTKLGDDAATVINYADGKVDLRKLGRIGSFTVAEHWKADMHTVDQELTFKLLRKMLNDPDEQIRLQSAFFLSILNDARTEPEIARILKSTVGRK